MDVALELPADMISEILSRTSLQTLDSCKTVPKGWKQLIYEPSFMSLYFKRSNHFSGFLIQTFLFNKYVSTFVSISQSEEEGGGSGWLKSLSYSDTRILASSNQGICVCEKRKWRTRRYYACKPATQQWQAIPNPKLRYQSMGAAIFVLRPNPLRYKIVKLSQSRVVSQYVCEIFDSELWAWKTIQGVNIPCDGFILPSHSVVSTNESAHWLTSQDNVIAFNVSEEVFQKFSLPESVCKTDAYKCKRLVECEGKLGFTCLTEEKKIELWLANGGKNPQWTKKMSLDVGILGYSNYVDFCSRQIAFIKTFHGGIFYNLQDRSFTEAKVDYDFRYANQVFKFRSDLEMVNLKGGR